MRKRSQQWVTYTSLNVYTVTRQQLWMRSGQLDITVDQKWYKYCSVSCTDRSFRVFRPQCIVTSHSVSFGFVCVYCFSLKAVSTIDLHYMTDRLQQFELSIFVGVLLKKQSLLYLGCSEGKQININFSFLGELPLEDIYFLLFLNNL